MQGEPKHLNCTRAEFKRFLPGFGIQKRISMPVCCCCNMSCLFFPLSLHSNLAPSHFLCSLKHPFRVCHYLHSDCLWFHIAFCLLPLPFYVPSFLCFVPSILFFTHPSIFFSPLPSQFASPTKTTHQGLVKVSIPKSCSCAVRSFSNFPNCTFFVRHSNSQNGQHYYYYYYYIYNGYHF